MPHGKVNLWGIVMNRSKTRSLAGMVLRLFLAVIGVGAGAGAALADDGRGEPNQQEQGAPSPQRDHDLLLSGQQVFRFDTFGDEAFWGDTLRLHQAIAGSRFGGVGAG